jgi:hypothetical protein
MTTQDPAEGLTQNRQNDLNAPKSTNTMNGIQGSVDKNTLVRWFLTNDEPWTKQTIKRTIVAKSNELSVHFHNGASVNLRMRDSCQFDITRIRFKMEKTAEEEGKAEEECGVCFSTLNQGLNGTRFSCQQCAFSSCFACQEKIVAEKGFLQCPGCRYVMWSQEWFVDVVEKGAETLKGFKLPPNHVFLQHFREEHALSIWSRTRANVAEFLKTDFETPAHRIETFTDFVMSHAFVLFKDNLVPTPEVSDKQYAKNFLMLVKTTCDLQKQFVRDPTKQGKHKKPTPERFKPYDARDLEALAKKVFGDWFGLYHCAD